MTNTLQQDALKADYTPDEALQVAEGPSTLRDLVGWFIERGARIAELQSVLELHEAADDARSNCQICDPSEDWSHCPSCSLNYGRAIDVRRAVLNDAAPATRPTDALKAENQRREGDRG